jgi:hypothetical protein
MAMARGFVASGMRLGAYGGVGAEAGLSTTTTVWFAG